jgi:hypothetical protein
MIVRTIKDYSYSFYYFFEKWLSHCQAMKVLLKLGAIYQMHNYFIYTCISKKKSSLWIEIVFKQKKAFQVWN